ncbi:emp24/gp25L/p24 family protein [archaeon]|nr:MAG: emp24/gp25L/p24 family protein [archaeon]
MTVLEREVSQLAESVTRIEDGQKYMWARERAARNSTYRAGCGRVRACCCHIHSHAHNRTCHAAMSRFAANESTNTRVVVFSIMEMLIMLMMGALQMYILRSFFEKRRRY